MNLSGVMGISTMKLCCRNLLNSFKCHRFINTLLNFRPTLFEYRKFNSFSIPIVGNKRLVDKKWKPHCIPNSNWGQSRVLTRDCSSRFGRDRGNFVISSIASDARHYTTSGESHVNGENFDRVYAQNGLNVKPIVVGGEEHKKGIRDLNVKSDDSKGSNEVKGSSKKKDVGEIEREAWDLLRKSVVNYCGNPVGTVAANDPADKQPLNYDQSWEKTVDCYSPGQGLMPASFKVRTVPLDGNTGTFEEVSDPDFGESAIGRVAPVDSGLWWIILLRAYGKITGDYALQERVDIQTGIKLILNLCLADGFDMFPSLLVTDGSCMIDRRMGVHGHPLEIQALFHSALRSSREMLMADDGSRNLVQAINNRLSALSFHIREYYWVDMKKINEIYRYNTEEYSTDATNKFNIYPDQVSKWLVDWIPEAGGYFVGNLQPGHMDFRFFTLGNIWAIISSLGTPRQNQDILDLIETRWDDLVGTMPLKICYPALEYDEWRIITGSDPKNTPWSYHNGGSWPTLLWQFTLACIKLGRSELAAKAVSVAAKRISADQWPEYYDTPNGRFIGKQSRLYQTWTVSGFLAAKMLLENPEMASLLVWEEDPELLENCVCTLSKGGRAKCSRRAARSQILV